MPFINFNPTGRMEKWIKYPTSLSGQFVVLNSLEVEDLEGLEELAKDKRIWQFYPLDGSEPAIFRSAFQTALDESEKGNQFPFTIFNRDGGKIIGSTRLLDIQPRHKKLEIGWTWLAPDYWGTVINLECKLLLLSFCFEELGAVRVQLKTDENNGRSRKAIEKIGGQFEGILRNDMIRDDQSRRNSAYYSLVEEEWHQKKASLMALLDSRKASFPLQSLENR
jgi:RimJ/RimL family protein N-acetyltransferase